MFGAGLFSYLVKPFDYFDFTPFDRLRAGIRRLNLFGGRFLEFVPVLSAERHPVDCESKNGDLCRDDNKMDSISCSVTCQYDNS